MEYKIILTWSKIVALIMLLLGAYLDIFVTKNGLVFIATIPFVVFLITGKQMIDKNKS